MEGRHDAPEQQAEEQREHKCDEGDGAHDVPSGDGAHVAAPGACPASPHRVARTDLATRDTAARTEGIASIAAVVPGNKRGLWNNRK